jgi:hypothetical protein
VTEPHTSEGSQAARLEYRLTGRRREGEGCLAFALTSMEPFSCSFF